MNFFIKVILLPPPLRTNVMASSDVPTSGALLSVEKKDTNSDSQTVTIIAIGPRFQELVTNLIHGSDWDFEDTEPEVHLTSDDDVSTFTVTLPREAVEYIGKILASEMSTDTSGDHAIAAKMNVWQKDIFSV